MTDNIDYSNLEERKLKEIEHSKIKRKILRGYERTADTHAISQVENLEELIKDVKKNFDYYFENMKYYSVTKSSEKYKQDWLKERCNENVKIIDFACGNGENAIYAASCGATAIGIDISAEGIKISN